jgi:lipopolysaccharide biosynthesis regulator YciM
LLLPLLLLLLPLFVAYGALLGREGQSKVKLDDTASLP